MQTATDFIKEELNRLGLLDKGQVMTNIFEKAKKIEHNQRGYTKEDVLKAGEIGEINHHDYKHIVKLLDEAREINETYGSKGSDDINPLTSNHVDYQNYSNLSDNFKQFSLYEHKETITSADTITSSQTEISNEEIFNTAKIQHSQELISHILSFVCGAQWYREQLKSRQ